MIHDKLWSLIKQRPFRPFRVHLTDGRSLDVPYRGMTLLAETYINIGIPITEGPRPICGDMVHVPLKLIDHVEEISDATTSLAP
jgi:hypothetical protein